MNTIMLRQLTYNILILPNQLIELCIRMLSRARFLYCKIVWAGPNELFYQRPQHQQRIDWLRKNVKGKTLEIGCSTGYITEYLGIDVGLDLDMRRLRRGAWFRPSLTLVNGDASKLPFKSGTFDTVLVPEILEHVPFEIAQKIVCETCRVGNRVLITIPKLPKFYSNPEHIWIPTTREKLESLIGDREYSLENSPNEDYFWVVIDSTAEQDTSGTSVGSRDQ